MTNLTQFKTDEGIELIIDTQTGEAFASQAGYARMSGVSYPAIRKRVERLSNSTGDIGEIKTAEIRTEQGIIAVTLLPARLVYKWSLSDNIELAEAMGTVGATVYLHRLAGYQVSSTAIAPESTPDTTLQPEDLDLLRIGLKSLKPVIQDGFILNELGKLKPSLQPQIAEAQKLLASHNDIPEALLSLTAIGKELGISARKVNRLLLELGYQIKNVNKSTKSEPDYLATAKGSEFSEVTFSTGIVNDNSTYQHLKWYRAILDVLEPLV